ncbi:MAG: hypothetical protein MK074_02400 [Phycisphaerales bacterium]|nr:hypothetical protein [Phycisphaerales bacterium]
MVLPAVAQDIVPAGRAASTAWVLPVEGPIDTITLVSLERRLKAAKQAGADAVVLELDTPGGDLEATLRILHALRDHGPDNTVAWVRPFAFSAGAIIALGTREIITAPGARLGDAAPITPLGPLPAAERAKIESPLLAEVTDAARRNGHDEQLAQAFVSVGAELWLLRKTDTGEAIIVDAGEYEAVFGEAPARELIDLTADAPDSPESIVPWLGGAMARDVQDIDTASTLPPSRSRLGPDDAATLTLIGQITDSSRLLTLTDPQARAWGLSSAMVDTDTELAAFLGGAVIHRSHEQWSESFARLFMSWPVRVVLIAVILIGFVVEMAAPGTGLFALGGTLALALLMGAPWLAGLSTWWPLIAVIVGLALIALEVIVAPGTLVAGIAGAILLLGGLVFAVASPMAAGELNMLHLMQGLLLTMGGVLLAGGVLWLLAGPLGLGSAFASRYTLHTEPAPVHVATATDRTGQTGLALTDLRPAGRVQVGDHVIDAICSGRWIDAGTAVRIVRDGMEVEVEPEDA